MNLESRREKGFPCLQSMTEKASCSRRLATSWLCDLEMSHILLRVLLQEKLRSLSRALMANYHKLWLRTTEIYSPTALEAQSPQSSCPQGHICSKGSREDSFLDSSSFGWLSVIHSVPWLAATSLIPASVIQVIFPYVAVSVVFTRTSHEESSHWI